MESQRCSMSLHFSRSVSRDGLRSAWEKRERFKELRTRGSDDPIEFELKYRETPKTPLITYHLTIDEDTKGPCVKAEWLRWRRGSRGKPFRFLDFQESAGHVTAGETPTEGNERIEEQLDDHSILAVSRFGQSALHPRVSALYRFVTGWHFSDFSADATRSIAEAGPARKVIQNGSQSAQCYPISKGTIPRAFGKNSFDTVGLGAMLGKGGHRADDGRRPPVTG